jgi:hypothetical protein
MKSVTTQSGFTAELDETAFNDMELFDALTGLDKGDMTALPTVVDKIVGKNKKALYDHLRADNGTVPIGAVTAEIRDIILALGGKNSSASPESSQPVRTP